MTKHVIALKLLSLEVEQVLSTQLYDTHESSVIETLSIDK